MQIGFPQDYGYQQDNATSHTARRVRAWSEEHQDEFIVLFRLKHNRESVGPASGRSRHGSSTANLAQLATVLESASCEFQNLIDSSCTSRSGS